MRRPAAVQKRGSTLVEPIATTAIRATAAVQSLAGFQAQAVPVRQAGAGA